MAESIPIPVGDRGQVFVELVPVDGVYPTGAGGAVDRAADVFPQVTKTIRICAEGFLDSVHEWRVLPSELTIEFGVAVDAKINTIITLGGNASFKVSMRWDEATLRAMQQEP
jgi:hypothetical protein